MDVRFADLPAIEGPTGRLMLQQMAAVAELEAGLISSRTKAVLARAIGRAVQVKRAGARAADLHPMIRDLQQNGVELRASSRNC